MESIENMWIVDTYVERIFIPSLLQAYNKPFRYLICQNRFDYIPLSIINHIPVFTSNQKNMLTIGQSKNTISTKPQIQTTKSFTYAVTSPIIMSQFINNVVVIGKICK